MTAAIGACWGTSRQALAHNPKVVGSNPAPATMNDEGLADVEAANPFRLPRLHPGIRFLTILGWGSIERIGVVGCEFHRQEAGTGTHDSEQLET
jgi:hypothetical protein